MKAIAAGIFALAAAALLIAPHPRPVTVLRPGGIARVGGGTEACGAGAAIDGLIVAGDDVYIHDLVIDGRRDLLEARKGLPPWNQPFTGFTPGNGIVIDGRRKVTIRNVTIRNVPGFAILVARSHDITIDRVRIENSGSRNDAGRNNTTGGILLEEGTTDFRVTRCELRGIRGNGIWTHSLYTSPRNARGLIQGNRFDTIGRDAIQVGHATAFGVLENIGTRIGYPKADVDATPVAIDTAGNVDKTVYAFNRFHDIDGKCIDLDGFHDGDVHGNVCVNMTGFGIVMNNTNPDMQSSNIRIRQNTIDGTGFGGVFVIGEHNTVAQNLLVNVNTTHSEDQLLRTGIYLGDRAERPALARGNIIEDNKIGGYLMDRYCIGGSPKIYPNWNTVRRNTCAPATMPAR